MGTFFPLVKVISTILVLVLVSTVSSQASEVLSIEDMASIVGENCYSYCKGGYTCGATQDCGQPPNEACIPLIGNCTGSYQRPESYSTCAYINDPNSNCWLAEEPTYCSKITDCLCVLVGLAFRCRAVGEYTWGGSYYGCP